MFKEYKEALRIRELFILKYGSTGKQTKVWLFKKYLLWKLFGGGQKFLLPGPISTSHPYGFIK